MAGWAVVSFLDEEDSIAVVPVNWISIVNETPLSYWPTKTKNITLYVKNKQKPGEDWPQYGIKILRKYDDYSVAVKKGLKAEATSELSSTDNDSQNRKKHRKFFKKYPSISEESQSEDDGADFRHDKGAKMPPLPKALQNQNAFSTNSDAILESNDHSRLLEYHSQPLTSKKPSKSVSGLMNDTLFTKNHSLSEQEKFLLTPTLSRPISSQNTPKSATGIIVRDEDSTKLILTKLNIILGKLSHLDERMDEQAALISQIAVSGNNIGNNGNQENENLDMILNELLPINDDNMLDGVNLFLKENAKYMVKELGRIGGNSAKEVTKKIMYRIITNEYGQLFSWEGSKGKRKFKELEISKIIIDAVRSNVKTRDSTDNDIITSIKMWLVKAKERYVNEKKKTNERAFSSNTEEI